MIGDIIVIVSILIVIKVKLTFNLKVFIRNFTNILIIFGINMGWESSYALKRIWSLCSLNLNHWIKIKWLKLNAS